MCQVPQVRCELTSCCSAHVQLHTSPQFHFLEFFIPVQGQGGCPGRTTLTATSLLASVGESGNRKESGDDLGIFVPPPVSQLAPSLERVTAPFRVCPTATLWLPVIVPRLPVSQSPRKTVAPRTVATPASGNPPRTAQYSRTETRRAVLPPDGLKGQGEELLGRTREPTASESSE